VTRRVFSCFSDPPLPLLGWKAGKHENLPMWAIFVFASYPAHPCSHLTPPTPPTALELEKRAHVAHFSSSATSHTASLANTTNAPHDGARFSCLPAFHCTLTAPPSTPLHHYSKNVPRALGHVFRAWLPHTPPLWQTRKRTHQLFTPRLRPPHPIHCRARFLCSSAFPPCPSG